MGNSRQISKDKDSKQDAIDDKQPYIPIIADKKEVMA
jgi:hypothetical protein